MRRRKRAFVPIIIMIVVAIVAVLSYFFLPAVLESGSSAEFADVSGTAFSVHFLQLGNKSNGDSTYIKCGDVDILIDAGSTTSSASTIESYLDNYVTDGTLEYVIATHSDYDHISGFVGTTSVKGIFDYYTIETLIDFPMSSSTSSTYTTYCTKRDTLIANGTNHHTALDCYNNENGGQRVYTLENGVEMEILYNYYYENTSSSNNDYSVCVMFTYQNYTCIFLGDLGSTGEAKLVEYYESIGDPLPNCTLFKASHHGSYTANSASLMSAIQPDYVVVSCTAGYNQFGAKDENIFPSQTFVDNVSPYTENVYVTSTIDDDGNYTAMNGNVVFMFYENTVKLSCSNNSTILKNTTWFKNNRTWTA